MLWKDVYRIDNNHACTALTMNAVGHRDRAFILSSQMHNQGLQNLLAFLCHEYGAKANTVEKKRNLHSIKKQYNETSRQFLHRWAQAKLELHDEVKFAKARGSLDYSARETFSNTTLFTLLLQALPFKQQSRAAHKNLKTLDHLEYFVGTCIDHEDIISGIQDNKFYSNSFRSRGRGRGRGRNRGRGQRFFSRCRGQNFFSSKIFLTKAEANNIKTLATTSDFNHDITIINDNQITITTITAIATITITVTRITTITPTKITTEKITIITITTKIGETITTDKTTTTTINIKTITKTPLTTIITDETINTTTITITINNNTRDAIIIQKRLREPRIKSSVTRKTIHNK